ncbi:hypothetical protein BsWGS_26046 [Bradybaena similaris]
MNLTSGAVIELLLTVVLWKTSQSACSGMAVGSDDRSVMRSGHRMLPQAVNVTEAVNNFRDTRKLEDPHADMNVFYLPELPHDSYTHAPADTRPAHEKPGATFRNPSRRFRKSSGRVYRSSDKEVGFLGLGRQGLYSSYASGPERELLTSSHVITSDERWRKIANSGVNNSEIRGQTVTSRRRDRMINVGLKAVLYHVLVKERGFAVQFKRKTGMRDASVFGYGTEPRNLNTDKNDTKAYQLGCNDCVGFRRKRAADVSDKTTQDYTSKITSDVTVPAKNLTTVLPQEETKSTVLEFSTASTVDTNQGSDTTKEATDEETSLPTTTFEGETTGNASMTTGSVDDIITAANSAADETSPEGDFTDQKRPDDEGQARALCSVPSDFGEYGAVALAVAVGIVALLIYALGMIVVLRRLIARKKMGTDLQCHYNRSGGPGGLELGPGTFPLGDDPEGPITNSQLNLLGPDTSLTSESDTEVEAAKESDCHNVSTFLLRRESQQKAEERAAQDREQTHHDNADVTNTIIVTEL